MGETIRCQHCGTFVPAEKAFCPNCSEPMEMEERPNRSHSFSSDMMSTIRDDPAKYKEMMKPPVKEQAAQPAPLTPSTSRAPESRASSTVTGHTPAAAAQPQQQTANSNQWETAAPHIPAPVVKGSPKRNFILAMSAVGLLVIVIALLIILKVF